MELFAGLILIAFLIARLASTRRSREKEDDTTPRGASTPRGDSTPRDSTPRIVRSPSPQEPAAHIDPTPPRILKGRCWVIDGDTIVISDVRIRLAGIDAPELDHPWGKSAKSALINLCMGHVITAVLHIDRTYDRAVATCYLPDGRDLAAELVRMGLAIDWPKFSGGRYKHLEPQGIRKKLWRADARQKGRYDAKRHG